MIESVTSALTLMHVTYQPCFHFGNPPTIFITSAFFNVFAVSINIHLHLLGLAFSLIPSVRLGLWDCQLNFLVGVVGAGNEMCPAFCSVDNFPFMVDDIGEVVDDVAFAPAGGARTTGLEFALLGCDRYAGDIPSLTKWTFLLYVSMMDFTDKMLTHWIEKQLHHGLFSVPNLSLF